LFDLVTEREKRGRQVGRENREYSEQRVEEKSNIVEVVVVSGT